MPHPRLATELRADRLRCREYARRHPRAVQHLSGWLLLAILLFTTSPGLTAADTKHDLTADPAGFLAGALHAWSDTFPLGQLQNQAWGYLFPQGAFFLLTDPLPDWIAQRLWWTLVVGVGFSGMLVLLDRLRVGTWWSRYAAAALFALAPRTLSTLTTISSETWPAMLAPWVVAAVVGPLGWRAVAGVCLPIAAMGAVNATATAAACTPAAVVLLWRWVQRDARAGRTILGCGLGAALVSAWWLGPLVVLGRYAPPFTDYIESAATTTRWLNPLEILRGTTSWVPYADVERRAGVMLVDEPVLVIATVAVAAIGLVGLAWWRRGVWWTMLLVGFVLLGAAHWQPVLDFLDGPGAALRNLHKFDPLVRIPLMVGMAALGERVRARPAAALLGVVCVLATGPAWGGKLLPEGAYREVPEDWQQAADFLNAEAAGTRTLLYPAASSARQHWGWTRDEPAQPLLDVPWVTRDAIPLVPPEAIRGLDGTLAVLREEPSAASRILPAQGIGAMIVRHNVLDSVTNLPTDEAAAEIDASAFGGEVHRFGNLDVVLFDPQADARLLDSTDTLRVAGGGEITPLLTALLGPTAMSLVDANAQVVTDTPALVARNYGTLKGATSAVLADPSEGADVRNAVADYPSAGPLTRVVEKDGTLRASSSASDATSFGGAQPDRSPTAALDEDAQTAWYPQPGTGSGEWLEADLGTTDALDLTLTTTSDTTLTVAEQDVTTTAGEPTTIHVPGRGTTAVRITLSEYTGIAELSVAGYELGREVTVPDTSPDVELFVFQRLQPETRLLARTFTAPRDMTVTLHTAGGEGATIDGEEIGEGDCFTLSAGEHRVRTDAAWLSLGTDAAPQLVPEATGEENSVESPSSATSGDPLPQYLSAADHDRLILTQRAANDGLRARLSDGTQLEPRTVGAGYQAFVVPAGAQGTLGVSFAGDVPYRWSLAGGAVVAALTAALCAAVLLRRCLSRQASRRAVVQVSREEAPTPLPTPLPGSLPASLSTPLRAECAVAAAAAVLGWEGLAVAAGCIFVIQLSTVRPWHIAGAGMAIGGAWLARAPWPDAHYAGYSTALALVTTAALIGGGLHEAIPRRGEGGGQDGAHCSNPPEPAPKLGRTGDGEDGVDHRRVAEEE